MLYDLRQEHVIHTLLSYSCCSVCEFDQAPRVTGSVAAIFAESAPPFAAGATITWYCINNNEQVVGEDTTTCQTDGSWMPAAGLGFCGEYLRSKHNLILFYWFSK